MGNKVTPAKNWKEREISTWNVATFMAYIGDKTRELYGVDYTPGGSGSKTQRWSRERGMLKNAQGRYGNAVLKRFIEICWREYRTNKPEQFPYPTFTFMISYMDRHFTQAQSEIAAEKRNAERAEQTKVGETKYEDIADWL